MLDRRTFIKTTAATTFVAAAPAIVRGQNLNSQMQLAAIGCDGKGWSDITEITSHPQVEPIAFCDIDLGRTDKVRQLRPKAPIFQDYREMFAEVGDKIDGVTISTPDHMHAIIATEALNRKKHIYCQKPLTHNVQEAWDLREKAAETDVITRLGNQIHSHTFYRTAVQQIQAGVIGKIKAVHSWVASGGHGKSFHIDRPEPAPVPQEIDWDLWIGVAPMRPYVTGRVYHPWGWRDWQDFGNGSLGDFGCHIFDPVFTALKITEAPLSMVADHTGMNDEVWPAQNTVEYVMPGTELTVGDTFPLTWYDGGLRPSVHKSHVPPTTALPASGSMLVGEEGTLVLPHIGDLRLYPQDKYAKKPIEKADDLNHYHGWVDGCLSGKQPSDDIGYGSLLTEVALLGNIAVRHRTEELKWDASARQFPNKPSANKFLSRENRQGW